MSRKPAKHPQVYTFELKEGLCYVTRRDKKDLEKMTKPSYEAVIRQVRIVPEGEYRKLVAAARRLQEIEGKRTP